MTRRRILRLAAITTVFTCTACNPFTQAHSNQNVVVHPADIFATIHNTPLTTDSVPGASTRPWDVSNLPSQFGNVNPVSSAGLWQPMNFGEGVPIFAANMTGDDDMATAAGVWHRTKDGHWTFLSGSERICPITAIAVSRSGVPIVANNQQIYVYESNKWISISDNQETGTRYLTWMPDGRLLAGVTYYPEQKDRSLSTNGPAPLPIYAMVAYDGKHWQRIDKSGTYQGGVKNIRAIDWSATGTPAVTTEPQGLAIWNGQGWQVSSPHSADLTNGGVNCVLWDGQDSVIVATTQGLWQVVGGQWTRVTGTPAPLSDGNILQLVNSGEDLLAVVQSADGSISTWVRHKGKWKDYGVNPTGVHFIGDSPEGVPTVELMQNQLHRELWQQISGIWHAVNMSSFPAEAPDSFGYTGLHDVTWWNGQVAVSSPGNGVWGWNGLSWNPVGGESTPFHSYHTGTITGSKDGTLFAEVKEIIPPPPTTPRREFNTLWAFAQNKWKQTSFPKPATGNILGVPVIASDGTIAVQEIGQWAGNPIWLYQNGSWQKVANGTGMFKNNAAGDMAFGPDGRLTIELHGPTPTPKNNIYEWTGSRWSPLLSDNSVVTSPNTYWFNYTWAPDGSMIVGLMNGAGYSVWKYAHGTWTDLGLHGQRPGSLYVTPDNTLFVTADQYVCWQRKL